MCVCDKVEYTLETEIEYMCSFAAPKCDTNSSVVPAHCLDLIGRKEKARKE